VGARRVTEALLADGRELVYFDEREGVDRIVHDTRRLDSPPPPSVVRHDPLLDEWVAIAGHRQGRTYLPLADECPLCPSVAGRQTEIPSTDYDVVAFENRFPAFAGVDSGASAGLPGEDLLVEQPGTGRCEVVCYSSKHDAAFSALPSSRVLTVIEAWVNRTTALSRLPGVEQVFCFENRGLEIGVTLQHAHGQIYGYPYLTSRTRRMLNSAARYLERTGRDLFADILAAEIKAETRIVARSGAWTAFVPFAARWPLEVHLYPDRQVRELGDLTMLERAELAEILPAILRRMEALYGGSVPYIAAWHQAPVRVSRDLAYLHMEIMSPRRAPGRLKFLAGSESAMDAWINDVSPETAASALRAIPG
jgi:UDPglucose--hexose-1-phosphate uridylyltransferase